MNTADPASTEEIAADPVLQIEAPIGLDSVELGPWQARLLFFQRVAGAFMIMKGLLHWAVLFSGAPFAAMTIEARSSTVFFAVIDLIAAVALWLGSPWGAAVWLIAVFSQVVAAFVFLDMSGMTMIFTVAELVLVGMFAAIRIKAHSEEQQYR